MRKHPVYLWQFASTNSMLSGSHWRTLDTTDYIVFNHAQRNRNKDTGNQCADGQQKQVIRCRLAPVIEYRTHHARLDPWPACQLEKRTRCIKGAIETAVMPTAVQSCGEERVGWERCPSSGCRGARLRRTHD